MRRNINGTCGSSCRNPNIRTINTMDADTTGNFEIRAGNSVSVTTETNGIRIAYTGGITTYDNTDGNLVIDNANFTIDLANDISIAGDMIIAGDLTVNGTYYTVHAEHVYTEDDYIIMRDGAVTGLGSGDFSGFQVKLYDGVNDGRLVIDSTGTARVGDVGDEQPLMTRDESADLTDGDSLIWDAANSKTITAAIPSAISTALAGKENTLNVTSGSGTGYSWTKYGRIVFMSISYGNTATGNYTITGLPKCVSPGLSIPTTDGNGYHAGRVYMNQNATQATVVCQIANAGNYTYFTYLTE